MSFAVPRRALFALALAAGALSGALYHASTETADVIVMARDLEDPRPLVREDVEIRTIAARLAPGDSIGRVDDVIGFIPRSPMHRGQIVIGRALSREAVELRGRTVMAGVRAVAIPVSAAEAVGGAVVAGSRVDVLAIPVAGRAPEGRSAEVLVTGVTVLDVRGESGRSFREDDERTGLTPDRIASVIIGIPAVDEARIADRIATSTFVLALIGER